MLTACSVCSRTKASHQAVKVSKQGDAAEKSVIPEPWSLEEHCFGLKSQPEAWDFTPESGSTDEALASSPRAAYTVCGVHTCSLRGCVYWVWGYTCAVSTPCRWGQGDQKLSYPLHTGNSEAKQGHIRRCLNKTTQAGKAVRAFNPSTQETDAGESLRVSGQPVHRETLSQTKQNKTQNQFAL